MVVVHICITNIGMEVRRFYVIKALHTWSMVKASYTSPYVGSNRQNCS